MTGYIDLLRRNPDYTRMWLAQAVSLLGDWFSTIALSALVVRYSSGSGIAVSGLLLARFLPPLLIGPFAGVLVDRFNRKRLMIASDLIRALVVLMFFLVRDPDHLWLIYALTIIQFVCGAVFEPARSALLPSLVAPEYLVKANILGSITWSVMLAAGAAIGGLVAAAFGATTALLVDAMTFLISALLIVSIRYSEKHDSSRQQPTDGDSRLGFRDGLRYIAQHPATAAVLLVKLGGSIGSIDTLMVIYATRLFVVGDEGTGSLGILYSAFGIGAVIGPIVLNRFNNGTVPTMRRLISIGYVWITLGWLLLGGAPTLLAATVAVLVKAMGSSIYWTYSSVILQKTVPNHYLGRVFALDLAGFQLSTVVSVLVTGWLIEHIDTTNVPGIALGTGLVSLIPLVLWTLAVPWIARKDVAAVASES
jgi:MFS family permease